MSLIRTRSCRSSAVSTKSRGLCVGAGDCRVKTTQMLLEHQLRPLIPSIAASPSTCSNEGITLWIRTAIDLRNKRCRPVRHRGMPNKRPGNLMQPVSSHKCLSHQLSILLRRHESPRHRFSIRTGNLRASLLNSPLESLGNPVQYIATAQYPSRKMATGTRTSSS